MRILSSGTAMIYDGFEFKEKETLTKYVALKTRFKIATFVSMASLAPALVLLLLSYISPAAYPQYLYLALLGISIPFSVLSFRTNSRITEIINSNEVRHVAFR